MSSLSLVDLLDAPAREAALNTSRSILIQAPAGSGKTGLLTSRFIKLLAEVEEPEEILAITFTKAATAEMCNRILKRLELAQLPGADDELASAALANSERHGWRLLDQPQRLNIQTIDSLCLRLAHRLPLASKLGGTLNPVERAEPLYRKAARRTFDRLGGADGVLNSSLEALLLLRDSDLANCEELLATMLATRDHWAHAFPLSGAVDWLEVRAQLEAPLAREVGRVLTEAHRLFSTIPEHRLELLDLATYACKTAPKSFGIHALAGMTWLPHPPSLEHWACVANMLLTKDNKKWLNQVNKDHGFTREGKLEKLRREQLMQHLREVPGLLQLLCQIRELPPAAYDDRQWTTLRHHFTTLRYAVVELDAVFAEEGSIDFVETLMSATRVLNGYGDAGGQMRHLLVDEFQDTSHRQQELIAALLRSWNRDDRRTLFLAGDPMQSIYLFRQADVKLFETVSQEGIALPGQTLKLTTLELKMNFRSNAGLVNRLNDIFKEVFPHQRKPDAAGVEFLPAVAADTAEPNGAFALHAKRVPTQLGAAGRAANAAQDQHAQREADAKQIAEIVSIVRRHLTRIESARATDGEFTVAILGRSRNHLAPIAAALRQAAIPFRAVELEKLGERQEILDLQSIVRALLHPMDRIAWLALLRAPWCGLELADLHRLCGVDERRSARHSVAKQIEGRLQLLSEDAMQRVNRLLEAMRSAQQQRYEHGSFSSWIERTWTSLGGPACVDAAGYENALAYFSMLDEVTSDGVEAAREEMRERLDQLFARPDPAVSGRCGVQLMTMHKAKGLGFNVVILPALHKPAGKDDPKLIQYLERTTKNGTELFVAPIGSKREKPSKLNGWINRQKSDRDAEERKRLLYVACTRAREELHLFATATVTKSEYGLGKGSLLATAWPALETEFRELQNNVLSFPAPVPDGQTFEGIINLAAAASETSSLRRLPSDWKPLFTRKNVTSNATISQSQSEVIFPVMADRSRRVLGTVVHKLFEQAANVLQEGGTADQLLHMLPQWKARAEGFAWSEGLTGGAVSSCAAGAIEALKSALGDQVGRWILSPHPQARNEVSWTGMLDGASITLRIDRCYQAGEQPLTEGDSTLWILDYKTADHGSTDIEEFLEAERLQYEPQLHRYGKMMRLAHGPELQLRFGLYYPLLQRLLWWAG